MTYIYFEEDCKNNGLSLKIKKGSVVKHYLFFEKIQLQ